MSTKKALPPIHHVRLGRISAAIWETSDENGEPRRYVTLDKSYTDNAGDWQHTSCFSAPDLLAVAEAARQAATWLYSQPKLSGNVEE